MKALSVAALMKTQVIAARRGWSLQQAETVMLDAGIRHLPVVDDADRLVGIVSQRDLGRAAALERTSSGRRDTLTIVDVMQKEVVSTRPEADAAEAVRLLIERKIGALAVVDPVGKLVGVITETDFLEVAREALAGTDPAKRARA